MNKQKNKHLLWTTLCILIACAIIGVVISAVKFLKNPGKTSASSTIEFAFDGAASGIAPNGYAFDLNNIGSDEVLEAALESARMKDRYTADQIRQQLKYQGVYPEDIVKQMLSFDSALDFSANRAVAATNYHPTQYSVKLYNDFDKDISKADLQKLLECIMAEYKSYFSRVYAAGTNEISVRYTLSDYDYPQQLTILTRLMEESVIYAEEMYEKEPSLMTGGRGFNDIALQLNNLIDTDINKLSANVTINALTKNPDRLIIQYNYEIRSLNNQLAKKTDQLARMDKLVSDYDKNEIIYLSTSGALTKIDGNSTEIYDKLITARNNVAEEITAIKSNIATYQLRLNDLIGTGEEEEEKKDEKETASVSVTTDTETTGDSESEAIPVQSQEEIDALAQAAAEAKAAQIAALEADIGKVTEKRETIMKEFAALIKLYNDKQINDLTVAVSSVKYDTPKLISSTFIIQTVKIAGPICVIGLIVCLVIIIHVKRKEAHQSLDD